MILLKTIDRFPIGFIKSYMTKEDEWLRWKVFHFFPQWLLRIGILIYRAIRKILN